ncbi:galactokinase [Gulosibacter faecalis]|jgi:galactokinase|uniref:Galactokinase n=1 Tax=Gulosibacter faecalis TaxID=272240 RepID=A0ABW5UVG4_9MICO|nr:galactokinase family protein [Gulosibacter faecalis]
MIRDTSRLVAEQFTAAFGAPPEGVWSAPGRVSLMGDHTDIEDGLTLSHATERRSAAAVSRRSDGTIRVRTDLAGDVIETSLEALVPPADHNWYDYPLGVVWAALEHIALFNGELVEGDETAPLTPTGLDIFLTTDLPIGGGLASSASICAAVSLALNDLWEFGLEPERLARLGYRVENAYVGASAGLADHIACLTAAAGKDVFYDARGNDVTLLDAPPLAELGLTQLLVSSGEHHRNWERIVADRHESCDRVARALGYQFLREAKLEEIEQAPGLDDVDRRRAAYVSSEIQRVLDLARVLRSEGAAHTGPLFTESQRALRDDFGASTQRIDLITELAAASGALGARMTGSGFGGSVFVLIPSDRVDELRANLTEAFREYGWDGLEIVETSSAAGPRRDA